MPITLVDSVNVFALLSEINQTGGGAGGYVGGRWPTYATLVADGLSPLHPLISIAVFSSLNADFLDVEAGDATNADAPDWVHRQQARGILKPGLYTSLSNVMDLLQVLAQNGITRDQITLWSAHYSGTAHICSPSCGFGMNTTADMTQWTDQANGCDLSLVADGVLPFNQSPTITTIGGKQVGLNHCIGGAASSDGKGYLLVQSDGGTFTFGDESFKGSLGNVKLNAAVVGCAGHPSKNGYWLVAADGGVFQFGDAGFFGSMGGKHLNQPIVGIMGSHTGEGYALIAEDGGIFTFGDFPFVGSGAAVGA